MVEPSESGCVSRIRRAMVIVAYGIEEARRNDVSERRVYLGRHHRPLLSD